MNSWFVCHKVFGTVKFKQDEVVKYVSLVLWIQEEHFCPQIFLIVRKKQPSGDTLSQWKLLVEYK